MKVNGLLLLCGLCIFLIGAFIQCEANNAAELNAQSEQAETALENQAAQNSNAVLVETVKLSTRSMQSFILLSSTVETENMVDVFPQLTGIVTELNVEEGHRVKKGSVLLKLDDREQKLAEEKAHINYLKRKNDFARVKESFDKKLISEVEYDNAQFEQDNAELLWKETQLNLSYTTVTSPINGVVAERIVRNGDRVQPSTRIFRVVDTSEKIARVFIPEKDISALKVGQEAVLMFEFLDNKQFRGSIKRISPVVDPNSGTFKVTVGITDSGNELRPGMFVSVRIITAVRENVIVVPKDAIVYDAGLPFIYVVIDKRANKTPLDAGFTDERYVESRSGLSVGDEIIIVGQSGLKDKAAVNVIKTSGG